MKLRRLFVACVLVTALAPPAAFADGYVSPFFGVNFGGDVGTPLGGAVDDRNHSTWGVAVGAMGAGVFGVELDLGYTSEFHSDANVAGSEYNVLTVMPALILGIPVGGQQGVGVRPYVVAGAGLIRRDISLANLASFSENDPGYTLGGGVMVFMGDRFGIRADVRYFRNFRVDEFSVSDVSFEPGTFGFSRAAIGAIVRF